MYSKALLVIVFLLFTIFPALAQNGNSYVGVKTSGMYHKTEKQGEQLKIWREFELGDFTYVGVNKCGMCHKGKKQGELLKIWQGSKHAGAYETLKTAEADKIAKEKGYSTKAIETELCLKCHAVGYNLDASLLGKKFKVEDGVQCEICHGPGSVYKKKSIMKDREKAVANGLLVYENPGEELCINCHNSESPTYVDFVFDEMWKKIEHKKPGSK